MRQELSVGLALLALVPVILLPARAPADEEKLAIRERPEMVTPRVEKSVKRGLDWLKSHQSGNGSWTSGSGSWGTYPAAMTGLAGVALLASGSTSTRGPYSKAIARSVDYLLDNCITSTGLITGPNEFSRSMYGHGFAMLYLASAYGMERDLTRRRKLKRALKKAIQLTARSQSHDGGWLYTPDQSGDEGSVTITQVQALRACRNAGLTTPVKTIRKAIQYIEKSVCSDGGISYRMGGRGAGRPPITAAAVAVLYNAGKYESKMAKRALEFCKKKIAIDGRGGGMWGHYYYSHLYLSQAMYQAGDGSRKRPEWRRYYPRIAGALIRRQAGDGSWSEPGVGQVYGTAIALTVLQLPYEELPIYAR